LEFRAPATPQLARIVIDGAWDGHIDLARAVLLDVHAKWPQGEHVTAIATCGAFVRFEWPRAVPTQQDNRYPDQAAVRELDRAARPYCQQLLSDGLREKLAQHADYITIGIDTKKSKISTTQNYISEDHAELVYVADLRSDALHFTGKSYPTTSQQKGLVRITDLETHFTDLNGQSALILGCHDLTIFNPRSNAKAKSWRRDVKQEFKAIASRRQPVIVLHHPHTTVKRMTWRHAWEELRRNLPSVRSYLGTGCYSIRDPKNGFNRDDLDAVLRSTGSSDVMDIIVKLGRM
jgi:transposase InsO family protein